MYFIYRLAVSIFILFRKYFRLQMCCERVVRVVLYSTQVKLKNKLCGSLRVFLKRIVWSEGTNIIRIHYLSDWLKSGLFLFCCKTLYFYDGISAWLCHFDDMKASTQIFKKILVIYVINKLLHRKCFVQVYTHSLFV